MHHNDWITVLHSYGGGPEFGCVGGVGSVPTVTQCNDISWKINMLKWMLLHLS